MYFYSHLLFPVSCDSLVLQGLRCDWGAGVLNLVLLFSLSHTFTLHLHLCYQAPLKIMWTDISSAWRSRALESADGWGWGRLCSGCNRFSNKLYRSCHCSKTCSDTFRALRKKEVSVACQTLNTHIQVNTTTTFMMMKADTLCNEAENVKRGNMLQVIFYFHPITVFKLSKYSW